MDLRFNLILSSPFLRAEQTAEIVAESLKLKKRLAFSDELTPDGNPKALIRQLNELKPAPENVLLVGHEPYLSRLIALLVSGGAGRGDGVEKRRPVQIGNRTHCVSAGAPRSRGCSRPNR